VAEQLVTFLIGFIHLTLSFDGWSSKGGAEIYTVHITTPLRQSYLVDGLMLTGLSTDGQNLFSLISEVSMHRQYDNVAFHLTVAAGYLTVCCISFFHHCL
jgi:hypothetical protein